MHSHRRSRVRILFEVLCALALGASFVLAWDQTGAPALLASAAIITLFALYWSFALFGSAKAEPLVEPLAFEPQAPEPEAEPRIEIFAFEPDPVPEPDLVEAPAPVAKSKPKRKSRKAKAAEPVVRAVEPDPVEDIVHQEPPHIEQLFDPLPFPRQQRPAFGRKSRGPLAAT